MDIAPLGWLSATGEKFVHIKTIALADLELVYSQRNCRIFWSLSRYPAFVLVPTYRTSLASICAMRVE